MADQTYLPAEPTSRPEPTGGLRRHDIHVEWERYPAVRARRELDARLLDGSCGIDGPDNPRVGAEDLDLLLLAAAERFSGDSALLRAQAIAALGALRDERADAVLADLALRVVEHDAVRLSAAAALGPERGRAVLDRLVKDPTPAVADWARRRVEVSEPERPTVPAQPAGDERSVCNCC